MSFFVKATVDALKTVPGVNAYIEGDEIVTNHYYDIGVAVSTDKGLVVPVIRDADRLTMAGIEAEHRRPRHDALRSGASSSPISPGRSSRSPTAASSVRCSRPRFSTRPAAPSSACTRSRNGRWRSTTRS